ncbi:hypothetical protein, partial [Devosia sp. MC1541]|uniref:hypothetical protein n=1 Tax=Devosia sp. MC1541 TaxID=2725264 RepID=UPI001AEE078A
IFCVPQNTKLARNLTLFLVHEYLLSSTNVSLLEMSREYRHIYRRQTAVPMALRSAVTSSPLMAITTSTSG